MASAVWYPIWDAGLRLDHAMRTPAEARRVASDDLRALLGLLDLRHVAGDEAVSAALREAVLADWRGFARRRLPDLFAGCAERAARTGDLAFSLEPDLKESRGGLRDLVSLRAVAASWVADVRHEGLDEARQTPARRARRAHDVTGRPSDRLVLQDQAAIAKRLGLLDADALLRQVAGVGRSVAFALDEAAFRVERTLASRGRTGPARRPPARHARTAGGRRGRAGRRGGPRPRRRPGRGPVAGAPDRGGRRAGRAAARAAHRPAACGAERTAARTVAAGRSGRAGQPARRRPPGDRCVGGAGPGRDHGHAAARLGTGPEPAAAQRRAPVHRRPAPRRGRGRSGCVRPPGRPSRPAAGRRAAARHRQGLAGGPLRGRRRGGGGPGPAPGLRPGGRRGPGDPGAAPPAAAGHRDPARPRRPGDGRARRRVRPHARGARPAARADRGRRARHRPGRVDRVEGGADRRPRRAHQGAARRARGPAARRPRRGARRPRRGRHAGRTGRPPPAPRACRSPWSPRTRSACSGRSPACSA